jgi:hypothetical protein
MNSSYNSKDKTTAMRDLKLRRELDENRAHLGTAFWIPDL